MVWAVTDQKSLKLKREWDKVYAKSIYLYARELYDVTEDPTAVLLLQQIMELAECISEGE
jgi:hypothetical protein